MPDLVADGKCNESSGDYISVIPRDLAGKYRRLHCKLTSGGNGGE